MLIPCAACRRHLEATERACPFCDAPNEAKPISRTLLDGRLSRAAVFAGAVALAPGCIASNPPPPQYQYQQQPPPPPPPDDPYAGDPDGPTYSQPPPGDPPPPDHTTQPPPVSPAVVRGRVTLDDGRPAPRVHIMLSGGERPFSIATAADGTYTLEGVAPGTYTLSIGGSVRTVQLLPGKETIVNLALPSSRPVDYHPNPKPYGAPPARRRYV